MHIKQVSIALRPPLGSLCFGLAALLQWCTIQCKISISLRDLAPQSAETGQIEPKSPKSRNATTWVDQNVDRCKSAAKPNERNLNPARTHPERYPICTKSGVQHSHFWPLDGGAPRPSSSARNKLSTRPTISCVSMASAVRSFSIGPSTLRNDR